MLLLTLYKMKFRVLFFLTILFAGVSCNDLLEVDSFPTEATDEEAIVGAYSVFSGIGQGTLYGGDFIILPELLALTSSTASLSSGFPEYQQFLDKDISATNTKLALNWRQGYEAINVANEVIDFSEGSQKGEAYALRGIVHFEMARLWGGRYEANGDFIPLVTKPTPAIGDNNNPVRAKGDVLFDAIEEDLIRASLLLKGETVPNGRIDYYAACAFLSRFYLEKRDYVNAAAYADTVLQSNLFSLTPNALDAFNNTAYSTEDVFAIAQNDLFNSDVRSSSSGLPSFFGGLTENGEEVFRVLHGIMRFTFEFDAFDQRYSINNDTEEATTIGDINTFYYKPATLEFGPFASVGKYIENNRIIPVIRLAELYLTRAEALAESQFPVVPTQAIADLNEVRTRAGVGLVVADSFPSTIAGATRFIDSVRVERTKELIFEGQLLHDLRRWEQNISSSVPWNSPSLIFPIPESETDVSGLE